MQLVCCRIEISFARRVDFHSIMSGLYQVNHLAMVKTFAATFGSVLLFFVLALCGT